MSQQGGQPGSTAKAKWARPFQAVCAGHAHASHEVNSVTKRHVQELSRVYAALLRDAAYAYPTLRSEFERDLERLRASVDQRGLHAYCVDLPAMGKHLDRCLSTGKYVPSGLPLSGRKSRGVPIPKFLGGLYLLVFDRRGDLKEDYDVQAVFFLRQILYVAKKAAVACSVDRVKQECEAFVELDKRLPKPDPVWLQETASSEEIIEQYRGFRASALYSERLAISENKTELSRLLTTLDFVSREVATALGVYNPEEWRFKHGPGAIAEATGPTNKYRWSNWSPRLESVFPIADHGFHSWSSWADSVNKDAWWGEEPLEISSEEPSSRLVDVPKTFTKPRLIACEPSEHQWCQQNIWHYFCTRSSLCWIAKFVRFRDQTQNQELCVVGSRDGSLATIDLSAASDRVTCHAVGQMFRSNPLLLRALMATRTRSVRISQLTSPEGDDAERGVLVELRKFSTMGSACTFPVESLLFLAVALSSVLTKHRLPLTRDSILDCVGKVSVFGDDIVIPEECRELLVGALEVLDFKVNADKSFWTGRFRESCGVDSFAGVSVTPAYWKAPFDGGPESYSTTLEVSNNFYQRLLVFTSNEIESPLRDTWLEPPLVEIGSGFCGRKTFCKPGEPTSFRRRFNTGLQRVEYKVPCLIGTAPRTPTTDGTAMLQYFTESPGPLTKWTSGVSQYPVLRLKHRWVPLESLSAQ